MTTTPPAGPAREPGTAFADPAALAAGLAATGYVADDGLATIAWLALRLARPLLLEGEPGTGKTALAEALGELLEVPVVRLQCYEGIDAAQALYDWDFPRQILRLRAMEAVAGQRQTAGQPAVTDLDAVEDELFTERFLLARPVLRALREAPVVLLVDEIDRADDEFEAFLLEVLSTWSVTVPELGTVHATTPPVAVLTSNRTRELHDALKRRCLYHWLEHPSFARELAVVRSRTPELTERLAEQLVTLVQQLRADPALVKPPGLAETLDWGRALHALGVAHLDIAAAAATLGAAIKSRDDAERVRAALDRILSR